MKYIALIALVFIAAPAHAQTIIGKSPEPLIAKCLVDFGRIEKCLEYLERANDICIAEYDKLATRNEELQVIVDRLEAAKVATVAAIVAKKKRKGKRK